MNIQEILLFLVFGVLVVSFYLQIKDRKVLPPPPLNPPAEEPPVDYNMLTKNQLISLAAERGITIPKSWNRARIIARLTE